MRAAGLRPIATVSDSEAVLITSSTPKHPHLAPLMQQITSRIAGFIASKQFVLCKYNIPQAKLHDATAITPGRRAPTVSVLEDENWRAVSALIERKNMASIMDQLVDVGASEVLIVTLYNCRV
jgi:ATP phosphoribosyltransferase